MQNVWKDENFGLASPDEAGREAALAFTRRLCDDLVTCARQGGAPAGRRVRRSAPASGEMPTHSTLASWRSGIGAARRSLLSLRRIHPRQNPEKGFLSLADEIDIVAELGVGIHLSWGRSAVRGAARRLPSSTCAGRERGCLTASCSQVRGGETRYGTPWIDGHLPAQADEPASLYGHRADRTLRAGSDRERCQYPRRGSGRLPRAAPRDADGDLPGRTSRGDGSRAQPPSLRV